MRYFITEEGLKTLSLLPKSTQKRILNKLDFIFGDKGGIRDKGVRG